MLILGAIIGTVIRHKEVVILEDHFIKIPKNILQNDKSLMIWCYIKESENVVGISKILFEDIIISFGYTPNNRKGKINDKFKESFNYLLNNKYMKITTEDLDFKKILKIKTVNLNKDFIKLSFYELDKLYNYNGIYDVGRLLVILCYIKSKIYRRSKTEALEHDKFEVCFPSISNISKNLNISNNTVKEYINELFVIGVIKFIKIDDFINAKGDIIYGGYIYCENTSTYEQELDGAKKFFEKKYISDGYKKAKIIDNRKLGGIKSSILRKINNNTATDKDIIRLNKINKILSKEK